MEKRIRRLGIFMVLCFVALFVQLNNIQALKANSLATNKDNPRVILAAHSQPRGSILSSDGVVLASSVLASSGSYKYQRVYNANTETNKEFSQIVGFDSLYYGRTGIEDEYNSYLVSHSRPAKSLQDLLVNRTTVGNVTLTVSSKLQSAVYGAIDSIPGSPSQVGAVVINPKTGAIEAMASNPSYDQSALASPSVPVEKATYTSLNPTSSSSPMVSRAYQYGFLPGSTFKTVTSSAVFDHDPSLATTDYPPESCITVAQTPLPLCNYAGADGVHETCGGTIELALPQSCNTVFAQYGMAIGAQGMNAEAEAFGFNKRIPLDLPYVPDSIFPTVAQLTNNAPLQAYSAFGQGTAVSTDIATALQMALVSAGLADKGVIMTPHVMANIRDSQGNLVTSYSPKKWLTATSPATAASVTALMKQVVTSGTASGVGFPAAEDVAAKTGTAEVGLNASQTNDWMVAFAPASDPKVAVAVVVPNQPGSATGASTTGPVMKAILAAALAAAS